MEPQKTPNTECNLEKEEQSSITFSDFKPYYKATAIKTVCESESRSVVSNSLGPHGLYSPWTSPGQGTGVGSPFLLQENSIVLSSLFCPMMYVSFFFF